MGGQACVLYGAAEFSRDVDQGMAVHFRCQTTGAENMRVDVMSRMRGVDEFEDLWERRTSHGDIEILSLPDLVKAKKTQRDKDWPMLSRLVSANYFANRNQPSTAQIEFWLRELREPSLLLEVTRKFPNEAKALGAERALLATQDEAVLAAALKTEEQLERDADREYWLPLKLELEKLGHQR